MSKKPENKPTWFRIEVIETGENFLNDVEFERYMRNGLYTGHADREVARFKISTKDNPQANAIIELIKAFDQKEKENAVLRKVISDYKLASEKIMKS